MTCSLRYILAFLIATVIFSCKERYVLPAQAVTNTNYLVVEGNINVGQDTTIFTLSRAVPLTDTTRSIVPETGAKITVETDAGRAFAMTDSGNGRYYLNNLPTGTAAEKYRLNITTVDNNQYVSDYVAFKQCPPIDSVSWEQHSDGVYIYVSSHDDAADTKYYRWNFTETWQYQAPFDSKYIYVNGGYVLRTVDTLYTCWQNVPATNIVLQSTAGLSKDVVYKKQLVFIPTSDYKIGVRYSILVKQSVLTQQGYNYLTTLIKNTEQLGSIFDALPSQLTGNIHAVTNPQQTVIGFVTASTTQQQRIYILRTQVNNWAYPPDRFAACDTVMLTTPASLAVVANGSYLVVDNSQPGNPMAPYYSAPIDCTDCRLKGGTTNKPPYWP
jgi:hypothetical protein